MSIEVSSINKFQPLTSNNAQAQNFDANGKVNLENVNKVQRVEEVVKDSKIGNPNESQVKGETKPLENTEANKEMIQKMLDEINSSMYSYNKELHFSVNTTTKDLVVKIVNGKTGEVLQQYPAQEIVDMREKLLSGKTSGLELESKAN